MRRIRGCKPPPSPSPPPPPSVCSLSPTGVCNRVFTLTSSVCASRLSGCNVHICRHLHPRAIIVRARVHTRKLRCVRVKTQTSLSSTNALESPSTPYETEITGVDCEPAAPGGQGGGEGDENRPRARRSKLKEWQRRAGKEWKGRREERREGEADREGTSRKSIRACFINGGKGIVVERDWKVGCEKRKGKRKKGKKMEEGQALRGERKKKEKRKNGQAVTVKSCFSLTSTRLDRSYTQLRKRGSKRQPGLSKALKLSLTFPRRRWKPAEI